MRCGSCGTDNIDGRKFCGECGSSLALACHVCAAPNPPDVKFCGECGSLLDRLTPTEEVGEASSSEREAPTAERRLVSVLFADLVGFTTLSETRDAEDVRELLSEYFETSRALIERYGGVVEKFIGDAVMAVWGTPTANEDDAERAVRAALELTAAVSALGEELGAPDLRARAGVLTGEAAVTIGAQGQGMVAGDLVNTASRIQSVAAPGEVFVGEATRRASDAAIEYRDAGSFELKGKAEPMPLWRAARVVALRGGLVKAAGIEPPFVGRDRELRLIKELFHTTADEERANLVSVVGVGGIGKSRLAWEFEKYIDGLAADAWWHRGRCLAYGDGVAFWALAEMVRGRAGIAEDEGSASASVKLRDTIDRLIEDPAERRFVEPRLAQLLGLEDRLTGDQENLFSAWRILFERMSDHLPVILIFEDIHWADSALLDFVEYLLDWSREHPVFVITLSRPELLDRRPTWGAGRRAFTSMTLDPLPAAAMERLLAGPLPGLPAELLAKILERAEGVPFYAVETVRMLIDRGIIVREGDSFRAVGSIETLEVPETLQALIAARLDGLEPAERLLLQDASVLGKTFTPEGLVAMTGRPVDEVEPLLMALVRKEMLSVATDPLSPDRGQYGFIQDLVKKVAYDTMSKRERKGRHLAAATHLLATADEDEVIEVVAAHYLDAYLAGPGDPDANEVRSLASSTLVKAGERAASLGARAEARRHFEQAADLSDVPMDQAALWERAGVEAAAGGQGDEGAGLFQRAIERFEELGATHPAARVSARLGEHLWASGKGADAIEMMERSFQVLSDEEPDAALATLASQLGRFLYFSGHADEGAARLEVALDLAEAQDLPEILSMALNTKGVTLIGGGRAREGIALVRFALDVALEHEIPSAALRAYYNLADAMTHKDEAREGAELVRAGLAFARRLGNRFWEWSFLAQVYPLYVLGEWDEIIAMIDSIPPRAEELARISMVTQVGLMAVVHLHRGDLAAALDAHSRFPDAKDADDVQERGDWLIGDAVLALGDGRVEDAMRAASEAFSLQQELGMGAEGTKEAFVLAVESALQLGDPAAAERLLLVVESLPAGRFPAYLDGHARRFRARMASDAADAERGFKAAIGRFRELEAVFWTAATELEFSEWLVSQGRAEESAPLLDSARIVFERVSARPWLERLGRLQPVASAEIKANDGALDV